MSTAGISYLQNNYNQQKTAFSWISFDVCFKYLYGGMWLMGYMSYPTPQNVGLKWWTISWSQGWWHFWMTWYATAKEHVIMDAFEREQPCTYALCLSCRLRWKWWVHMYQLPYPCCFRWWILILYQWRHSATVMRTICCVVISQVNKNDHIR
jgi:hypothetical protein